MDTSEPQGLDLSLDDMIKSTGPKRRYESRSGDARRSRSRSPPPPPSYRPRGRHHHPHPHPREGRPHYNNGPGHHRPHPRPQHSYKDDQHCFIHNISGNVIFKYRGKPIITVNPAGDITLNTSRFRNKGNFNSLNDALNPLGIRVTAANDDVEHGQWQITVGKSLVRFEDGVVLPGKGEEHRGQALYSAFKGGAKVGPGGMPHQQQQLQQHPFMMPPPQQQQMMMNMMMMGRGRGGGRGGGVGGGRGGSRYTPY